MAAAEGVDDTGAKESTVAPQVVVHEVRVLKLLAPVRGLNRGEGRKGRTFVFWEGNHDG
jgi:hypothetical protein